MPQPIAHLCALARTVSTTRVEPTAGTTPHASGTTVAFTGADGTKLIGKIHRTREHHTREVRAYQNWTSHLGDATPRLLAADADLPGIVLTAMPGTPLDEHTLELDQERTAHKQAGALLRHFHYIPVTATTGDLTTHLAERAEQWIAQTATHLPDHDQHLIRSHMHQLQHVSAPRIAACHLDFQPRNLLWTPEHGVALIDFEHSRIDLAARDLTRLATRYWPHRPDLKNAFLTGYGTLSSNDEAVLEHCTALEALTSLAYGLRHRDDKFLQHSQTVLSTLR